MSASTVAGTETGLAGVRIRALSKTFPGTVAIKGLDLDLAAGEVHALVGANGSGKSTLVKILAGCERPDPGSQIFVGDESLEAGSTQASFRAGCRFVHQDLALIDSLSVADNVLLTGGWPTRVGTIRSRVAALEVRQALTRLGAAIPTEAMVRDLSPVMRTIVAVTRALRSDPDAPLAALVLDEPTARLPRHEVSVLERVVREIAAQGAAVMIVSHHLEEVLELADVVTVLRDGVKVFTKAAPALTRQDLVTAMMGEDFEEQVLRVPGDQGEASREVVLECQDLAGGSFVDLSLEVGRGEIVGVAGLEGSGRDELLPAIFGASERVAGTVRVVGEPLQPSNPKRSMAAGLAYLPADRARSAALPELTARENLTLADLSSISRPGRLDRGLERREAQEWFARVGVRPEDGIERPLATFSGGNQQKIMFARCLRRTPSVLLLDEPTYGVDVAAQASLRLYLLDAAARGAGVLISSSDEEELATVCHRVLVLRRGRLATVLKGHSINPTAIAAAAVDTAQTSDSSGGVR